jgi:hypothetical protein
MNSYLALDVETELHPESIDEWIVETLYRRGPLTLDYLNSLFPKCEGARLLFAVDRLSRAGKIVISPPRGCDYLLSADPAGEYQAAASRGRSCDESLALLQNAR